MAGAMVETRLGLLAMAHVVAALGGVDWVDLDTAFLLAGEPFEGGWSFDGPRLRLAAARPRRHGCGGAGAGSAQTLTSPPSLSCCWPGY